MKGLMTQAARLACCAGLASGLIGCDRYHDVVDPCWPQRYNYMAHREVHASMCPQVNNGHVLDQTIWNYHFEAGTANLTAGGLDHLAYLARRRPHPDTCLFLQTAQDITYDANDPSKLAETRADLDYKRVQSIQKFLTAQTGGQCAFKVEVHDPAEVGLNAIAADVSSRQMLTTRFRGGLLGGTGGGGAAGGAGATGGGSVVPGR